jgi:hypothetical protein
MIGARLAIPVLSVLLLTIAACGDTQLTYQPDDGVPIQFTLDGEGHFNAQAVAGIVTPIGEFELSKALPQPPDGETLLYIDHQISGVLKEDRFAINTDKTMVVLVDGRATLQIQDRAMRITVDDSITRLEVGPHSFGDPAGTTTDLSKGVKFGSLTNASLNGQSLTIAPPLSGNIYGALWGVDFPSDGCGADITFDITRLVSSSDAVNMGFGVSPDASITDDQPVGTAVQYEQESPPEFARLGSFIRIATWPDGAYRVEAPPLTAPDVSTRHHVHVSAQNGKVGIQIDNQSTGLFAQGQTCGGVALRTWGAAFRFDNLIIKQ